MSFVLIHFGWQNFPIVLFCSFIVINGKISILPIDESNWTLHYNIHNTYPIPTSLGDCWSHIQISLLSWKFSSNQNTYNVRAKLPCRQLQSFQALTFFSKLVEMRKIRQNIQLCRRKCAIILEVWWKNVSQKMGYVENYLPIFNIHKLLEVKKVHTTWWVCFLIGSFFIIVVIFLIIIVLVVKCAI